MVGGDLICGPAGVALAWYWQARKVVRIVDSVVKGQVPELIGALVCSRAIHSPVIRMGVGLLKRGMGSRRMDAANDVSAGKTWKLESEKPRFDRMVIMLHEADKAGTHVDVHIGKLSFVKRLPKEFAVSKGADGRLTEACKTRVMDLIAAEFKGRAWLAQNLDHSIDDARCSWIGHENGPSGYGAGESRQLVSDEPVWLSPGEHALRISAPHVVNNKVLTVFKIMEKGERRNADILALGVQQPVQPILRDRLHLAFDQDLDVFKKKVGVDGTYTVKYDGASTYIETGPKGTVLWSPRISKRDGRRIEYTSKVPGVEGIKSEKRAVGMGELLFKKDGEYLSAAEIGGLLNGSRLPISEKPEIRVYRNDIGQVPVGGMVMKPDVISYVSLLHRRDIEGFVGVPKGQDISAGRKFKWRGDCADWELTSVGLKDGDKGGVAGVCWFKSLDSGKLFKLGPGAMGDRAQAESMMARPEDWIGRVAKVEGFNGHEGRAARIHSWHLDKGWG